MAGIAHVITSDSASGAQVIDGSLTFDSTKSTHLTRTPSAVGNRRTWTWSAWVKRNKLSERVALFTAATDNIEILFEPDDKLRIYFFPSGAYAGHTKTNASFRDTSAWYHIVFTVDTTQTGNSNISKIYVNGVQQEVTYPNNWTQNGETNVNNTVAQYIGSRYGPGRLINAQLSNVYLIDGQAVEPEEFGFTDPLTNTWKPKKFSGSFTTDSIFDGTTWSNSASVDTGSSDMTNAFDGDTSTATSVGLPGGGATVTFTPSSAITVSTGLRVYMAIDRGQSISVNGSQTNASVSAGWNDTGFTGSLTSLVIGPANSGSSNNIAAIEIDGNILIDGLNHTGVNSFYLPLDGNSPIGKDQSGKGNDFTPVNFGGSVALDNPQVSGARPILNTTQGGTQAGVGVFGSKQNVGYAVTVYNDGGGNKYYIDGVKQDTVTGLIRGATYTFDTSDSTVSSHPFRFSATSNGSHGGGTEYTNGVAAITGAATTITVPYNAPETLYYYCTSHSGMGADITGITTNEKLADQYASHCTLALPLVGANSDVCASIACTSTTKTMTSNGNAAASSVTSNFYNGSFKFDGTGDHLTQDSTYTLGTGDFTVEAWVYTNTSNQRLEFWQNSSLIGAMAVSTDFNASDAGNIITRDSPPGSGWTRLLRGNTVIKQGWNHCVWTRESGTLKFYVDGVLDTSSVASAIDSSPMRSVGGWTDGNYNFDGYLQDVRVYKGVAKYTSDFVVPSRSPDILPDTPSGVSGSSKLTKITDGAVSFEGTNGTALQLSNHSDIQLGSGTNWTIEFFAYRTGAFVDYDVIAGKGASGTYEWFIEGFADGSVDILYSANGSTTWTGQHEIMSNMALNRWYHIALVRNGSGANNFKAYVDGKQTLQTTAFDIYAGSGVLHIGGYNGAAAQDPPIIISNFRIVNGSSVYTSRFTPPTAPLTNVTNTKLLCCQSNSEGPQKTAVIPSVTGTATAMWPLNSDINDDSGNSNNLSENGGSTSFTSAASNSFGITNAANFAKDGKYLSYAVTPASTWTIDGYIRLETTTTSAPYILGWNGTDGSDTCLGFPSDGSRKFSVFGSSNLNTDVVAEIGRWYHVRITTNGTTDLALYVDGVLAGRSTSSDGSPASPITIGDVQSGRFSGQIAGVRYTPTDLGAPPLGGETTSSGVTSNSPSAGVGLAGDVAATNFNPFNTDINTVRGQETGYATLNPLDTVNTPVLSNGNLDQSETAGEYGRARSTLSFDVEDSNGYYAEITATGSAASSTAFGIIPADQKLDTGSTNGITGYKGLSGRSTGWWTVDGAVNGTTSTGFSANPGDVLALAVKNGSVDMYINGVFVGTLSGLSGQYSFITSAYSTNNELSANFGQKPFKFPPPDGFQPLNAANTRPVKVISRPDQFFAAVPYTGNSATNKITTGFAADFVWIKNRDDGYAHCLFDTVRGAGKRLESGANYSQDDYNLLNTFNDNGFTLGIQGGGGAYVQNTSGVDSMSWSWKAGGSKNTFNIDDVGYATAAAAGLTGGGYAVTGASVGTKQGFSIMQWEHDGTAGGYSMPHGLTQAPKFIITRNVDITSNLGSYHYNYDNGAGTHGSNLNSYAAASAQSGWWNNTAPTNTQFSLGTFFDDAGTFIAYLWHDVPGLQKFGTYEGNSSSGNGPFVELGFRPAMIMLHNIDINTSAADWVIYDTARNTYNPSGKQLYPNRNIAEADDSGHYFDILSNGFKVRSTSSSGLTNSSHTFIYCAWAEAPSVDLYGGGANAR